MTDQPIMPPTHPGFILRSEFLEPLEMTEEQLAQATGIQLPELRAITSGRLDISAATGLRLSRYFGLSEGFWTGLQSHYVTELAADRARGVRYEERPDPA